MNHIRGMGVMAREYNKGSSLSLYFLLSRTTISSSPFPEIEGEKKPARSFAFLAMSTLCSLRRSERQERKRRERERERRKRNKNKRERRGKVERESRERETREREKVNTKA